MPGLVDISNSPTPYRTHFHNRVTTELSQLEFHALYTHGESNSPWRKRLNVEHSINFGQEETSANQSRVAFQNHEWRKGRRICSWIKNHGIEAMILGGYNDLGRIRILRFARRNEIPCFLWADSNIRCERGSWLKKRIKQQLLYWLCAQCTGFLVCGRMGVDYFKFYGAREESIFLVPYEPDYSQFTNLSPGHSDIEHRPFGNFQRRRRFIYSGRLVRDKRPDLVLKAFIALAELRPDWDLVLVGDGPLKKELNSIIPGELNQRIYWMGFIDGVQEMASIYAKSDILVLPSDFEPWGVVVNEAVSAGLAVIASQRVGAAFELIQDHFNGRVVPCGSMEELKFAMLECSSSENLDRMKRNSISVIGDWRAHADPIDGLRSALRYANLSV